MKPRYKLVNRAPRVGDWVSAPAIPRPYVAPVNRPEVWRELHRAGYILTLERLS